jgi:AraC-like DNA-binding protein
MAWALEPFRFATSDADWLAWARSSTFRSETLAQSCRISPRHLRRYFRRRFGCSTQAWLDEQRMRAAGPLLRNVRCVKQAAFELGFKQVSHFSRQFKKFYGINPSAFLEARSMWECPPQITNVRVG